MSFRVEWTYPTQALCDEKRKPLITMTYLQITLRIAPKNRPAAVAIYTKFKNPFLQQIAGAKSKDLLVRDEDVQVLHGFDSVDHAKGYLGTALFKQDVVGVLTPLLDGAPDIRIYQVA